jgi:hypothetical protein
MTVTQLIKGKPKYRYFESGRILLGYTIRSNDRDTWICILLLQMFIQKCFILWAQFSTHTLLFPWPQCFFYFQSNWKDVNYPMALIVLTKIILYNCQFDIIWHAWIIITTLKHYYKQKYCTVNRSRATYGFLSQQYGDQSHSNLASSMMKCCEFLSYGFVSNCVTTMCLLSNTKARSFNHCCRGKATSIKYYTCLYSCLSYLTCKAHAPLYTVTCDLSGCIIFFHIIS